MKKYHVFLAMNLLLAGLLGIGFFYVKNQQDDNFISVYGNEIRKIWVGGKSFKAEIVSTPEKKQMGLSNRPDLCQDCAMLFLFEKPGAYPFWMKDMHFDLDIIWISGDLIVAIEENASFAGGGRNVLDPKVSADKVLEIKSGLSDELGLKIGDRIKF